MSGGELFERAGGAWPLVQTVAPHDVAAPGYGVVDLLGDILAVGDAGSDGNGVRAGAVYTYAKATTSASADCASSRTGPARLDGVGTGCVEPGTGDARCPYATVGTSTVAGMTPYGAVAFPFAWTNSTEGFTRSSELELSSVAPLRQIAFWPRAGITYYSMKTEFTSTGTPSITSKSTTSGLGLDVEPMFVFSPASHFGITAGPVLDFPLSGSRSTEVSPNTSGISNPDDKVKYMSFGLAVGVLGYF